MNSVLSQKRLKELLYYDTNTGIFTWLVSPRRNVKINSVAGVIMKKGYRQIMISQKGYQAHRLAWLYVYGELPSLQVDHRNKNKDDNRISNLRLANNSENKMNSEEYSNNTSGQKGVHWLSASKKWAVRCSAGGVRHYLGLYKDFKEACDVYNNFAKQLHGEFYYKSEALPQNS